MDRPANVLLRVIGVTFECLLNPSTRGWRRGAGDELEDDLQRRTHACLGSRSTLHRQPSRHVVVRQLRFGNIYVATECFEESGRRWVILRFPHEGPADIR